MRSDEPDGQKRVTIPRELWRELRAKDGDTLLAVSFARIRWVGPSDELEKLLADHGVDIEGE